MSPILSNRKKSHPWQWESKPVTKQLDGVPRISLSHCHPSNDSWYENTSLCLGEQMEKKLVMKACPCQGLWHVLKNNTHSTTLFIAPKSIVCKMRSKVGMNFLFSQGNYGLQKKNTHFRDRLYSKWGTFQFSVSSITSSLHHSPALSGTSFAHCEAQCPFSYIKHSQRACSGSVSQVCFGRQAPLNPNFQRGSNW